jgi:predicted XRE-type DNA-binding protein
MKIDWEKAEAMAEAMTDEEAGIKPGEKITPEEGRRLYLEWSAKVRKRPSYAAALRRVEEEQKAARALRLMRERAKMTQREVARRMDVKAPAVSRLERFGASTIRALTEYARACGYSIRIVAESKTDSFAFA